jgi:outer membrane protein assembly factor BamB
MVIAERGLVVVGAWSGKVYALDEHSGATVWESAIGGKLMGSTAYSPSLGLVYVGSPLGVFYALDAADGTVRWSRPAGARVMSSPAVSGDERAVIFAAGNRIHALEAASGNALFEVTLDGELSGSPTLVGNRIYITAKRGGLWAIETYDP